MRSESEGKILEILKWLWDCVAEPVLSATGLLSGSEPSRIWWCPVGLMSFLPIHAAGYHLDNSQGPKRTVIDRVISAYTSTIKALSQARRKSAPSHAAKVLVVAMPTTPKYENLPLANDEAYGIKRILKRSSKREKKSIDVVVQSSITAQQLRQEILDKVIVHRVCHAIAETDASKSRLLLREGNLSVAQISQMKLEKVALAYLSACSTAYSSDALLDDESITLTSAFQVAGFPRVVGSLWDTVDSVSYCLAMRFYEKLDNDTSRSAASLREAIIKQREFGPDTPSLWAAFTYWGD